MIELIERVVQALVHVLQVEQDDPLAELHAQLDLMNFAAYLRVLLIVGKRRAEYDFDIGVLAARLLLLVHVRLELIEYVVVLREEQQVAIFVLGGLLDERILDQLDHVRLVLVLHAHLDAVIMQLLPEGFERINVDEAAEVALDCLVEKRPVELAALLDVPVYHLDERVEVAQAEELTHLISGLLTQIQVGMTQALDIFGLSQHADHFLVVLADAHDDVAQLSFGRRRAVDKYAAVHLGRIQ